jgi:Mitochondrial glycoprotein
MQKKKYSLDFLHCGPPERRGKLRSSRGRRKCERGSRRAIVSASLLAYRHQGKRIHTLPTSIRPSLTCNFDQPSVPGALSVDAVCQEGVFVVENVSYYNDAKLATDLTPEADWKRRGLYIGPQVRPHPFCCFVKCACLRSHCFISSKLLTFKSRRNLRNSSKSVASTRALRSSFPNTRSTRNKRYPLFFHRFSYASMADACFRSMSTG